MYGDPPEAQRQQRARRARNLLQVDAKDPGWTDGAVAETYGGRVQTVEKVRRRCVLEGFRKALQRHPRDPRS